MKQVLYLLIYIGLALTMGCSKPDRSGEAEKLIDELTDLGFENLELALARVDSAEEAGVFTVVQANTVKAIIYENADWLRMAAYCANKAIAAEAEHTITTPGDSNLYCIARWILADGTFVNGEYGKSISLAKEIRLAAPTGTASRRGTVAGNPATGRRNCQKAPIHYDATHYSHCCFPVVDVVGLHHLARPS